MTLLICPLRPGDQNEEMRYAMRSWQANLHLASDLELWTVGYKPNWLNPDRHIEGNRYASMPLAVFDNIEIASREAAVNGNDEVVFMNDDFFCLDPVGSILPVKRNQTLWEQIAQFPANASTWWPRSLRLTADWLTSEGFPYPDSYEVHRPLFCKPDAMVDALSRWSDRPDGMTDTVPQWRTVYGVLNKVDAYPVVDAKLNPRSPGFGTPWVSTSDASWRRYALDITRRFQKPSRWE